MSKEYEMQTRADITLAETIEKVKALGYKPYDIEPHVRLTNNRTRIGSAQELNRAFMRVPGKRGARKLRPGLQPLFRISIARSEFATQEDLLNVMFHEVIHTCPDCQNHGKTFKAIARHVNRVYGTNVTTMKEDATPDEKPAPQSNVDKIDDSMLVHLLESHIGEEFHFKRLSYKFTGFNFRNTKNSCELLGNNGKRYKAPPRFVAEAMGIISS